MAQKMRIHELAKELCKNNKDLITVLESWGIKKKTHSSTIDDDLIERLENHFANQEEALRRSLTGRPEEPEKAPEPEPATPAESASVEAKPEPKPEEPALAPAAPEAAKPQPAPEPQKKPEPRFVQLPPKKKPPQQPRAAIPKTQFPSAKKLAGKRPTDAPTMADLIVPQEETEEVKVPERFRKEAEGDKVEKFKVKPVMQKAFQAIRKIDSARQPMPQHPGPGGVPHKKKGKGYQPPAKMEKTLPAGTAVRKKALKLTEGMTVKDFAELISVKSSEVIKKFMGMGYMPNINQPVDIDAALLIADGMGIKLEVAEPEDLVDIAVHEDTEEQLSLRPPIVTIMGHVDHGKTSLLDAIRETHVTASEAGGITQHIGAYKIKHGDREIVFLDTPGHEAFTTLRARGASVTDIVILVVAADDGVKPQTIEAIDHAKAAGVPIIVAINKIDKPGADPQRVRTELTEHEIVSEEWGGSSIFAEISAKKRVNIDGLLELILLQADVLELKANPDRAATGVVIESRLDKGRGPVATLLVQNGTLKIGDIFVSGANYGRVKALYNDLGHKLNDATVSTPVELIGFGSVPNAGDTFVVVEDEKTARQIAMARMNRQKAAAIVQRRKLTLDDLFSRIKEGEVRDLNIIVKGDVQGSVEALKDAMEKITHAEVNVRVIHSAIGGINESDVMLAAASNAIIIGFNVRPDSKAKSTAEREGVDIELYNVIYEAIDDVKKALEGMLKPTIKEKVLGRAEVRNTFVVSRVGTIAGCMVVEGMMSRASDGVRVIRDNIVVYQGRIGSLKRFKDDAKEVQQGYECGLMVENFNDIKVGDIIENFAIETIAAKL